MLIHKELYKIKGTEVSPKLNVTLPAIAGFLQEAAWMHSMNLKVSVYELHEKGLTWILSRLIIEMEGSAKHNQTLIVATWPSGFDRHNIFRDYQIMNGDGNVIGQAKSIWVIWDIKNKQVVNTPSFIADLPIQKQIPLVEFGAERIPVLESYSNQKDFIVNWLDIDVNRHVNHISYIKWIIESAPQHILRKKEASSIDVVFRSESGYGDIITAFSQEMEENSTFLHKLVLKENQKEVTLAKTKWI